jgi:hypothetical protein
MDLPKVISSYPSNVRRQVFFQRVNTGWMLLDSKKLNLIFRRVRFIGNLGAAGFDDTVRVSL